MATQTTMKTADIIPDPNQPRQQKKPEEQSSINASVALHGILQALGVRPDGKLVWGHSRLIAAIAAGLKEVPVVILDTPMTESEYLTLSAIENMVRFDLSPHDQWRTCVRLREANPGWQNADVAKALSVGAPAITKLMSPSKCSVPWQEALAAGRVGIGDCYVASGLPEADQAALLEKKLGGASRDDIARECRKKRNGGKSSIRLSRVKIAMPEGAMVVITGDDLSMGEVVELLADTLKEARKAAAEQYDVKTFQCTMRDRSKKTST